MRTIKFRVWDKTERRLHYFDFFDIEKGKITYTFPELPEDKFLFNLHRADVMQFTGLLDKNGKEIYEGDIFDCIYKSDGCEHKSIVIYSLDWTGFVLKRDSECQQVSVRQTISDVARYEVIGNIHQNPGLINQN